jgi:acyl-CoA thioesterase YciA
MPADVNKHGDVFGGWIMSQVDLAGGLVASHRARGRVVTVAVNEFIFKEPVFVGDLLSFYVEILSVGRTSITVGVEVYATRNPGDLQVTKVTEARCTYVATDDNRKPRPIDREA